MSDQARTSRPPVMTTDSLPALGREFGNKKENQDGVIHPHTALTAYHGFATQLRSYQSAAEQSPRFLKLKDMQDALKDSPRVRKLAQLAPSDSTSQRHVQCTSDQYRADGVIQLKLTEVEAKKFDEFLETVRAKIPAEIFEKVKAAAIATNSYDEAKKHIEKCIRNLSAQAAAGPALPAKASGIPVGSVPLESLAAAQQAAPISNSKVAPALMLWGNNSYIPFECLLNLRTQPAAPFGPAAAAAARPAARPAAAALGVNSAPASISPAAGAGAGLTPGLDQWGLNAVLEQTFYSIFNDGFAQTALCPRQFPGEKELGGADYEFAEFE